MSEPSITYVSNNEGSGDWAALYVDGKRVHEGHDVPTWVWIEAIRELGIETEMVSTTDEEAEAGYPEFWKGQA